MIQELIKQWEENKHKLEDYFRKTKQDEYSSYDKIVYKLFELCLPKADEYNEFDLSKIKKINDGDWQGTIIYIIPKDTYQPSMNDYVITHTYYGSCSGCDTLQGIRDYEGGYPSENQIKEYMTLALHIVQKTKWLSE